MTDRRQFMFHAGALGLASGFQFQPFALHRAEADEAIAIIDAHCHIFNADDLPVMGFIEKIDDHIGKLTTKYPQNIKDAVRYAVAEIVDLALKEARSAESEAGKLADGDELRRGSTADEAFLAKLAARIKRFASLGRSGTTRLGNSLFLSIVGRELLGRLRLELFPARFGYGPGKLDPNIIIVDGSTTDDEGTPISDATDLDYANAILASNKPFSQKIKFAVNLTNYRVQLARKLTAFNGPRMVLATPALIDFSRWLNDKQDVKLDDQVKAMGQIARLKPDRVPARFHAYAPFCPLREALFAMGKEETRSSLQRVKEAISDHGFIGVKLYPPMGFRPIGNSAISNAAFRGPKGEFAHLRPWFGNKPIGKALDDALNALYTYCSEENVPILTHGAHSNGVTPGAEDRAAPEFWGEVLRKYPKLRLSIAHFGDFEPAEKQGNTLASTWEYRISTLMAKHPNLYADISFFHTAFLDEKKEPGKDSYSEALRRFGITANEFDTQLRTRLIYGSDWIMLGIEDNFETYAGGGAYARRVEAMLRSVTRRHQAGHKLVDKSKPAKVFGDADIKAIFSGNAARFLGLTSTADEKSNRKRLEAFYATHSLDAAWLRKFDTA